MSMDEEDAADKAARLGLDLVQPADDEVFVDIDSRSDRDRFDRALGLAKHMWADITVRFTESPSGLPGHEHAYVKIPDLAPIGVHERIALQAALCSDPYRELLAIFRGRDGYQYTSVFFEKPKAKELAAASGGTNAT